MKLLGTYMACCGFEGFSLGPLGRVHENYCTGDNVRKCTHALFCSRALYWEGIVLLIVLVTIFGYVSLFVSSCCFFLCFSGQVQLRVGDVSVFRVSNMLNWCTVLITIIVSGNAVRSQAHSSCEMQLMLSHTR